MIRLNACPKDFSGPSKLYIFVNHKILIKSNEKQLIVPIKEKNNQFPFKFIYEEFLGIDNEGYGIWVGNVKNEQVELDGYEFKTFREFYKMASMDEFVVAGYAVQIYQWRKHFQYCGSCGHKMVRHNTERAMQCKNCNHLSFPRISPAVIVAVKKGDQLLLAHNSKFREGLYSVIAGYIEPGEIPEEAAKREVLEEVGVHIKNLRYIKSQFWPFPDSLMMGYIAEYKSGNITPDNQEIDDAGWYNIHDFNNVIIPGYHTIARWLIDELFPEIKGIDYEK